MSMALAPTSASGLAITDGAARVRVARIDICGDPGSAAAAWDLLEAQANISPYQRRQWLTAWLETRAADVEVRPFIIVAYDEKGRPIALLPFGLKRQGPLVVAGFLGGRDSNYNLGLFGAGQTWTRASIEDLLRRAARAGGTAIDLFVLHNQPHGWDGHGNPFALLPYQPSPSFAFKGRLTPDVDLLFRTRMSKDSRKKLRRKKEKLAESGLVRHRIAETPEEALAILVAFAEQRKVRCEELGLGLGDLDDLLAFLRRASVAESREPVVELHALYCGSRILATFGCTVLRGRLCGMIISFDSLSDLARWSPGDILLSEIVAAKCREGIAVFDLGVGEGRYKESYCPEPEPLFETVFAVSPRGKLFAAAETVRLRAKRSIKQSAWAWSVAKALRQCLVGTRPSRVPSA